MGAVISIHSWDEDKKRDEVSKSFKHHITWYLLLIRSGLEMDPAFTTTLEEGRAGCAHFTDEKSEEGPSLAQGCVTGWWWS